MRFSLCLSALLALICLSHLSAQPDTTIYMNYNLIPNPGFEELRRALPANDLDGSQAFRNSIGKWASPTESTPDLYHFDYVEGAGEDAPRSGQGMVGILTHNPRSKRSHTYREYIQAKLDKTLVKGQEYYIEFWVKRASNSKLASNNIGAIVRPDPIIRKEWRPILHVRPIAVEKKIINKDQREWVKISDTFTASGSERFLIIGNFYNNQMTRFADATDLGKESFKQAYYFIDDIGLYQNKTPPPPEPAPVAKPASLDKMEVKVGQIIQLDRIYFETAKWNLLPASYIELDELVALLNKHPGMKIAIHGHTDSRGTDGYNQNLSENRAKAVYNYLLNNHIDFDRIGYEGFGEARPIATNQTAEGRQMNRRVEFEVMELPETGTEIQNISIDGHK